MPPQKPIPVRLSDDLIARLDRASERLGTNRAALIRFLAAKYMDVLDAAGDDFRPNDMTRLMDSLDGRKNSDSPSTPDIQNERVNVTFEPARAARKLKPKA